MAVREGKDEGKDAPVPYCSKEGDGKKGVFQRVLTLQFLATFIIRLIIVSAIPLGILTVLIINGPHRAAVEEATVADEPVLPPCSCNPPVLSDLLPLTRRGERVTDPYPGKKFLFWDTEGEEIKAPYPHLCVLARTYPAMYRYLPAFLASWTQMPMDSTVLLLVTQEERKLDILKHVVSVANALGGRGAVEILPISEEEALKVKPDPKAQDYGYSYTDAALDLLSNKTTAPRKCDYLLVTNGDNLYSRLLPRHIVPLMKTEKELIAFDFVSGHYTWRRYELGVHDSGLMKCIEAKFKLYHVDLGAIIFSMKFLRRTGLRFLKAELEDLAWADGAFAERADKLTNKKALVAQTLLLHQ